MEATSMGVLSILPPLIAIILAFWTRDTIFSLGTAIFIGVLISGQGLMGFPNLLKNALGNTGFSWILLLELFIGVLIAFFQRTGAINSFTDYIEEKNFGRKQVQLTAWVMGMFVFFSDYFSPIFVGSTMRNLSDDAKVSREKLAYICDSTSAPVSVLVPITGWGVFLASLLVGFGPIETEAQALKVFTQAIPFNFYAIIAVLLVGGFASGIIPEFGPMKKAEERAMNEGKVLADNARPLMSEELTEIEPFYKDKNLSIFLNFILPVLVVISIALGSFIMINSAKTMEAFLAAAVLLGIIMKLQGMPLSDIMETAMTGIKGVMPAVMILAFAYAINDLSLAMGTADFILSITESWITPKLLPLIIFFSAGVIAFSTGTSWGTFGIMMPIAVPIAFSLSGGVVNPMVLATISAVAGGGVFGDHCSPLSDTTILSSMGAASDHIDHVKTQIPYALTAAGLAMVIYIGTGFIGG